MVAPTMAFGSNEARFGTSFVLYSGLLSPDTGVLGDRKLVVHDVLTDTADTIASRVVDRFRGRFLSSALLPEQAQFSARFPESVGSVIAPT